MEMWYVQNLVKQSQQWLIRVDLCTAREREIEIDDLVCVCVCCNTIHSLPHESQELASLAASGARTYDDGPYVSAYMCMRAFVIPVSASQRSLLYQTMTKKDGRCRLLSRKNTPHQEGRTDEKTAMLLSDGWE